MVIGVVTRPPERSHFFLELDNIFGVNQFWTQAHISLDELHELFCGSFCRHLNNPSSLEYFQNGRILRQFSPLSSQISFQIGKRSFREYRRKFKLTEHPETLCTDVVLIGASAAKSKERSLALAVQPLQQTGMISRFPFFRS